MNIKDQNRMFSTYKEFSNNEQAEDAARALRGAGFDNVATEDLSHSALSLSDTDLPTPQVEQSYEISGVMTGVLAGAEIGLLLFGLPPLVLGMKNGGAVVVVGTLVCMVVGATVGLIEGMILAKRFAHEHQGRVGQHAVGLRVSTENSQEILRAKALLANFGEPPRPWFKQKLVRHFAH